MKFAMKAALGISALVLATQAAAQVTFYEHEGFRGRVFTTGKAVGNLDRFGFNDRASSLIVEGGRWEICDDARFSGRCVVVRRGSYENLRSLGLHDRISSLRPADARRRYENEVPAGRVTPSYEYRRRPNERLYEANVTSVRAVVGPPDRRCWVDRDRYAQRGDPNVGGAIAGALLGGILGHQVGSGRGQDAATVAGVVAGAAIGSNVGRDGNDYNRPVRRCEDVPSGPPQYWDVAYVFRGAEHHVQMSSPPGRTVLVNRRGEPRG